MPFASVNGVRLAHERAGRGRPVVLICGSDARKSLGTMHQTPCAEPGRLQDGRLRQPRHSLLLRPARGYTPEELVQDTVQLIETLDLGPCSIAGTSLGAMIAQQVAALRPELVRCAVPIAPAGARTGRCPRPACHRVLGRPALPAVSGP